MNNKAKIFENKGMGKCVVLKDSNTSYSLIYALSSNQFVIVSNLDFTTGDWQYGHYFDNDIDKALHSFNEKIKEKKQEEELER